MSGTSLLSLDKLTALLSEYAPDPNHKHDPYIVLCLQQVLETAREGNFGVDAILVDESKDVILHARNRVSRNA